MTNAWTELDEFTIKQLLTTADMDVLLANLNYLHKANNGTNIYTHPGTGGNYTVNTAIGQEVDSTNMRLTITTAGGLVLVGFHVAVSVSDTSSSLRLNIAHYDAVTFIEGNMFSNSMYEYTQNYVSGISAMKPFIGLPAGQHTFSLVWGCAGGGTGTMDVSYKPQMWVLEVL